MDSGERKLHLRLHARDLRNPETGRLTRGVSQERGLADARFAADDQDLAFALADPRQKSIEHSALGGPAHEPRPAGVSHGTTLQVGALTLLSRQGGVEAAARGDPQLAEHLVQVPLDGARTKEHLLADLGV